MTMSKAKAIPCAALKGADESAAFRNELRGAREVCARDAEAFDEVLFVVERLGCRLSGRIGDLGSYQRCLSELAQRSLLVAASPDTSDEGHPHFPSLFEAIRLARNEALHHGAVARHLASRVIELALILEDALASELQQVRYLMVKNPIVAETWQTLSAIRQVMLANAFSYLPLHWSRKWYLVSDHAIAIHLLMAEKRKAEMAKTLENVLEGDFATRLMEAPDCSPDASAAKAVEQMKHGVPVLVFSQDKAHLVGLVSPADLL
jgi:CBS domain-containing protein